jgi:hypothetical protein
MGDGDEGETQTRKTLSKKKEKTIKLFDIGQLFFILLKGCIVTEQLIEIIEIILIPLDSEVRCIGGLGVINHIIGLELFSSSGKLGGSFQLATEVTRFALKLGAPLLSSFVAFLNLAVLSTNPKISCQRNRIKEKRIGQ